MILEAGGAGHRLRDGRLIFRGVDLAVAAGELLCILGPNGVGKTTLLRCLTGLLPLSDGTVRLGGRDIAGLSRAGIGRLVGSVPQSEAPVFAFSVREMVEMGRAPHLSWRSAPQAADRAIAAAALARLGIAGLAERAYPALSGGERQLVLLARALAQQPRLLVLDEPTAHLDFANAMRVVELARGLADGGLAVVMTSHSPDHAFLAADRCLALGRDLSAPVGPPHALLTEALLSALYGRAVRLARRDGRVICYAETTLAG
jgi:iron complex transport system ATP-binding protein